MTKDEFEESYCKKSDITREQYSQDLNLISLPCNCELPGCQGFAAIPNESKHIRWHNKFNGNPKEELSNGN